jgi:crotonobetainyl-CoA:carnitine CoA-transferase CaiB-like acyl-CoA transferase
MPGPLDHLKIIELGHVIAGPFSAALLSDFGADVIKIEAPNRTDMMRDLGPKAEDGAGVWWKTLGRNKKILSLDWKSGEGRDILPNWLKVPMFLSKISGRACLNVLVSGRKPFMSGTQI